MCFIEKIRLSLQGNGVSTAVIASGQSVDYGQLFHVIKSIVPIILNKVNKGSYCFAFCDDAYVASVGLLSCLFSRIVYVPITPYLYDNLGGDYLASLSPSVFIYGAESDGQLDELLDKFPSVSLVVYLSPLKIYDVSDCCVSKMVSVQDERPDYIEWISHEENDKNHPVYLMFTSGSTGKPKPVLINYMNLNAYLLSVLTVFEYGSSWRYLQVCDFGFDLSIHEILICFLTGGTLFGYGSCEAFFLYEYINEHKINSIFVTPSVCTLLIKQAKFFKYKLTSLKQVLICGEPLLVSTVDEFFDIVVCCRVYNLYGPTESTIACTYHEFLPSNNYVGHLFVPIGYPFEKVILSMTPERELVIGGDQVYSSSLTFNSKYVLNTSLQHFSGDVVDYDCSYGYIFKSRVNDDWSVLGYRLNKKYIEHKLRSALFVDNIYIVPKMKNLSVNEIFIISELYSCLSEVKDTLVSLFPLDLLSIFRCVKLSAIPFLPNSKVDYTSLSAIIEGVEND